MRETINYSYNLNLQNVENFKDYCRFNFNNKYFYFVPLNRKEEELEDLINCSKELKAKGINCHDIILNKDNSVITKVNDINYVLLKVGNDYLKEFGLLDILDINNKTILSNVKNKLYRNNWGDMWSSKIDYFEYQIRELGKDNAGILNSFSYYVGLGENAISYVNKTVNSLSPVEFDHVTLCHRRLFCPNIGLNYLNPLSFIFDLGVRDIAEYIKGLFFSDEDAYSDLELYLKLKRHSQYGYQMLFARLLYPSYYFDIYEKIMNKELECDSLIHIISKANDYEFFLKKAYNLISSYSPIERIEWLLKKEL